MVKDNGTLWAMTKRVSTHLALLLVITGTSACAQESAMILELKDVQSFQIKQINSSPVTIAFSGLAFHSALAVQDITTFQENDSMQVLVHLTPAKEGLTGTFSDAVKVPGSVNTVSFGKNKVVIWDRRIGVVHNLQ